MEEAPNLPSLREHQRHLSAIIDRVEHVVEPCPLAGSYLGLLESFLLANEFRKGPIVVKTSTADLRDRNHEPESELLDSIFSAIRRRFPDREALLVDGPAFSANYRSIANHHGWIDLAARHRVEVDDLNEMMAGELLDESVYAASLHHEAALTISVVKAKTHRRTGISGAEKALVGYLSGAKMGYPKLERRHYLLPSIYSAIRSASSPMLHIIDGYNAIEGNGPLRGTPMSTEFILVGEDPVALDVELARLYNFDPKLVISLFHSLESSTVATDGLIPPTLLTTEESLHSMAANPARPAQEQPWLYRSLAKATSWRSRRTFTKIREGFLDAGRS